MSLSIIRFQSQKWMKKGRGENRFIKEPATLQWFLAWFYAWCNAGEWSGLHPGRCRLWTPRDAECSTRRPASFWHCHFAVRLALAVCLLRCTRTHTVRWQEQRRASVCKLQRECRDCQVVIVGPSRRSDSWRQRGCSVGQSECKHRNCHGATYWRTRVWMHVQVRTTPFDLASS